MGDSDSVDEMTDDEREAIEAVERGLEEFHRAHGALVEFHHAVGRAIEHFDEAETRLQDDHVEIAERIRDDVLPAGVTDDDKLTYELVEEFETGLLAEGESVANASLAELADGRRYPIERAEHGRSNESGS